jgi:mercuric ion transport protein
LRQSVRAALSLKPAGAPFDRGTSLIADKQGDDLLSTVNRLSMFGAVLAALAASSCCVLPALLAVLGVSGIGAAGWLSPYRPLFLGLSGLLLASAAVVMIRQRRKALAAACNPSAAPGCECPPAAARKNAWLFLTSAIVVLVLAGYPYVAQAFRGPVAADIATPPAPTSAPQQVAPQQTDTQASVSCPSKSAAHSPCACGH